MEADFSGYATKNGLTCSDGRIINAGAFTKNNGQKVPLVWQHRHNEPENVLGHALIEERADGYYAYGFFNSTPSGANAKDLVVHGDITHLSIYANNLVQKGSNVVHGMIREVSLVLSGANPGAFIDNVNVQHSDGSYEEIEDEAVIYSNSALTHEDPDEGDIVGDQVQHADGGKTVQDVFNTLSEEQQNVVYFLIGEAINAEAEHGDDDGDDFYEDDDDTELRHNQEGQSMSRNVFDQTDDAYHGPTLTHSQITTIVDEAKECGSFKKAFLAHADEYGITNIDLLFPDAQQIDNKPEWITRRMEWVERTINGCRKLPFSKIKSMSADLTHEEARAKGYIKGDLKKEQFFALATRETGPKTIYKKQKLDRDDIVDITDFDVVAWIWVEMRFMLREEIARAILIGDGRDVDDPDKIDETKIRPIALDDPFYTDEVSLGNAQPKDWVEAIIRGRETYLGTGTPTAFMTRSTINDLLLLKDGMNRRLYRNRQELAAELEVGEIVEVPVLDEVQFGGTDRIVAIIVNLADYSIGSTRGGEITTFDDFDIDYNQYKYLIEGRMSGALTKHKTAQVVTHGAG